ncbi:MAG: N-6 DNA methylase, partial [Desulfovibrio sp.]|nr:N-6 DNA methylase [Desulfovibrio sp.]
WERFLRVAYGRFEAADYIFLIHSYLSVLAKMIAYAVVSGEDFFDDQTIKGIVSGEVFLKKNIANFTDNDFYRWIDGSSPELKKAFRVISSGLGELDFSNVKEDILKGVYQELVDDDTRHALGECYTPDWLCARIIDALKPRPGQKILDPACGSGSFLKSAANFMISQKPDISASELNECLYGIDIHPLSAQITKATLLIAYGKRLAKEKEPLRLNVYLANSLALPSSEAGLLGQNFRVVIDNRKIRIPADIFTDYKSLTRMIDSAETLAEAAFQTNSRKKDDALKKIFANRGFPEARLSRAALDLHDALLAAKQEKRDGIWAFILANTYAPIAMKGQFDLVVGNPPWLTYSDIKTSEYQKEIKYLAENTGVAPKKGSLITHIELAALFVAQSASYFLKPDGKLAFVMPRSVFVADHHDALRKGRIKAFAVDTLWDLKNVKPLFKIPSCVLFGHRSADRVRLKIEIPGLALSGKLPAVNCDIGEARELLTTDPRVYLLASMNERSAWTEEATRIPKPSPYKDLFNQGATLVPRCLCFIDIDQDMEGELEDRIVKVKSARASYRNPDPRWKDISISGNVHSKFIFKTILANNMAPFAVTGSYLVALPITTENGVVEILSPDNIELAGYIESAIFFRKAFSEWDANKTENNAVYSLSGYFNYLGKLSKQKFTKKFSVIYNRSGKDAAASVISGFSNRFVYDNSAYYFTTDNENEAFYICAVLNSSITNGLMKPFQSKGNFGPRDIHKKILDVPIPEFDPADDRHLELARLAKVAALKAEAYIRQQNFDAQGNNMTPKQIGDFRKEVRGIVKSELDMIDRLTEEILAPFL